MKALFDDVSLECSRLTTRAYSTSFSMGSRLLDKKFRMHIYSIYGFVRFADEIVDTFHDYDKETLFQRFKKDTYQAIEEGISLNPILNSFQRTVREFSIDKELIETFLNSMEADLSKRSYDQQAYEQYIVGSAEVVGLMCLKVFCSGNAERYEKLRYSAMRLGAAFQKINFLRDLKADYEGLGRIYFPGIDMSTFDETTKKNIEADIQKDFEEGYAGITRLPNGSRLGVYVAYVYFYALFRKIQNTPSRAILGARIRIPNNQKAALLLQSYVRHQFNLM